MQNLNESLPIIANVLAEIAIGINIVQFYRCC